MSEKVKIKKGCALFLDRDGVINKRIFADYVKHPDQFEFIPGVLDAVKIFSTIFKPIIVVTNQQGIGKALMTEEELEKVHFKMLSVISAYGGRIDKVLFSPDLVNSNSFTRKPSVGMGLKARKLFPSIRFKNSIIAGDSYSDILFGHRLGMTTVLIGTDEKIISQCSGILNYRFDDLFSFANALFVVE